MSLAQYDPSEEKIGGYICGKESVDWVLVECFGYERCEEDEEWSGDKCSMLECDCSHAGTFFSWVLWLKSHRSAGRKVVFSRIALVGWTRRTPLPCEEAGSNG